MNDPDNESLVSVYTSTNHAIIAVVKSILDESGIQYFAKGDNLQNTTALNIFPVEFQVMPDDFEFAKELLKDVEVSDRSIDYGNEEDEEGEETKEE
jgi:Putative prokaryotic signal transducing protein